MSSEPPDRAPDLVAGPLRLWVVSRPYPSSTHPHDRDWLSVVAEVGAHGALVRATGAIVMSSDFGQWGKDLRALHSSLKGEAVLDPYEPNLKASVRPRDRTGHMTLRVEITPDHMEQGHWFEETIDQSYLPTIAASCEAIAARFPAPSYSGT